MAKKREGRKAQSTHITVYMRPCSLPRVTVGICNRPGEDTCSELKVNGSAIKASLRAKTILQGQQVLP